jgi:3-hydroxy-9,10-secoandrosta-1,3,5(10)-triene-9,17-dione monooxygenase reductase component
MSVQQQPTGQRESIAIDPGHFRDVLAQLPTGVAVIASHGDEGPLGLVANSVTSVSLDPPLILFCPAKTSTTWPKIRSGGAFCLNVLADHHEDLSRKFARKGGDRFAGVAYSSRDAGPALTEAVAWIECGVHAEHDAGDHTIVVASVMAMERAVTDLEPLVFFRGRYGSFRAESAVEFHGPWPGVAD